MRSPPPALRLSLHQRLAAVATAALSVVAGCELVAGIEDLSLTDAGANDGGVDDGNAARDDAGFDDGDASPSCRRLPRTCGSGGDRDCCESLRVPTGTFKRSFDGVAGGDWNDPSHPATVSDFNLDRYEITVGRYRRFYDAYPSSLPSSGAGKNPTDPTDPGWDVAWTTSMLPSKESLVQCVTLGPSPTWTPEQKDASDNLAMNCLNWFTAFAFCIFDHGRLPTEAEWNYAAAGGDEQRSYPWSVPGTDRRIDDTFAVYNAGAIAPVGSKSPTGDGRWHHADLAGNVSEWVVDRSVPYTQPCRDCAAHGPSDAGGVIRGGWYSAEVNGAARDLFSSSRGTPFPQTLGSPATGARCARAPL